MTQTFNEDVDINGKLTVDGEADETQMTVRAHSIQNQPLQSWQDNAGEGLVEVASDGRLQIGDDAASGTPEALLEVNRAAGSESKPKRGLHVAGEVADDDSDDLKLSVHELTLSGNNTTTQKATALNVRTTVDNADVDEVVGLEVGVESLNGGTMGEAVGLQINDVTDGMTNYALKTGAGQVQLGDLTAGLVESDADGNLSTATSVAAGYLPTMTGADGVNQGSSGMVPEPSSDDNTKYLRGDGQWVQPGFDIGVDGVSQFPINESEMLSINAGSNVTVDYDAVGKSVTINADAAPYIPPSDGVTVLKSKISQVVNTTANPGIVLDLIQVEACSDFIFDSVTNKITCQRTGRYYLSGGIANRRGALLSSSTTVIISLWKVNMPSDIFIGQAYSTYEGSSSTIVYDTAMFAVYFDAGVGDQFYFTATALNAAGSGNLVVFADAQQTITIRDAYMAGPSGDNIELQRDNDFVQWRISDGVSDWQNLFSLTELNGVDAPYISLKPTGINQTLPESPIVEAPILFLEDQNSGDFSYDPVSGKITVITPGIYLVNAQFPVESFNFSNAAVGGFSLRYTDHSDGDNEIFVDNATTQHSSGTALDYASFSGKVIYLDAGDKVWIQGRNATVGTTDLRVPSWAGVGAGISIVSVEKNGPRGYNIELQRSGDFVQWRQDDNNANWQNLFSLTELNGVDAPYFFAGGTGIQQNFPIVTAPHDIVLFSEERNSGDFSFDAITGRTTILTPGIYAVMTNFTVFCANDNTAKGEFVLYYSDASDSDSEHFIGATYTPSNYAGTASSPTIVTVQYFDVGDKVWVMGRNVKSVGNVYIPNWNVGGIAITSVEKNGLRGYNVELQNNGTHVQWRQDDGSASWQDLFSLSTIEGMDAPYFYAQQPATSQSFVKDTFTVVNLDAQQNSGDFSFSSNVVTVNTSGVYTIVGTVNTAVYGIASTTGATSQANIMYKTNGGSNVNAAVSHLPVQYNSQFANHTPTVTLQLNSGDQIWLETRYFGNGVASSSEIEDWGTSSLLIFSPAKRGPKGDNVELRATSTHLQWRQEDDNPTWQDLVTLSEIAGAASGSSPTGTISAFAGSTAPLGWLLCAGQEINRATYSDLFMVVGTIYGAGDGSTTFNLPDLRGRVVGGLDNMGGSSADVVENVNADSLGGLVGAELHRLIIDEVPSHNHSPLYQGGEFWVRSVGNGNKFMDTSGTYEGIASTTSNAGGDSAHNNMQPTMFLNYIIKI